MQQKLHVHVLHKHIMKNSLYSSSKGRYEMFEENYKYTDKDDQNEICNKNYNKTTTINVTVLHKYILIRQRQRKRQRQGQGQTESKR